MLINTGLKVEYFTEDDVAASDINKEIVIDDHVTAGEIFEAIVHSRGKFDFRVLEFWKNGDLHVIKVVNKYGSLLDYAGYILYNNSRPHVQIFPSYKNIIHSSKIHDLYKIHMTPAVHDGIIC